MKIIDEKGRLFGLINLLDLAVLIGVLIACFVGISAWIALLQPELKVVDFRPTRMSSGSPTGMSVKLENERYLLSARLFLIPESFEGSTLSFTTSIPFNVRDSVMFSIPGGIEAGTYRAEIETVTMDVFRRKSVVTTTLPEKFTVEKPVVKVVEKPVVVEKPQAPVFDKRCLWSLDFEAVVISSDGEMPGLSEGDSLVDIGGIAYELTKLSGKIPENLLKGLSKANRDKAVAVAGFKVTAVYDSLGSLLNRKGALFTLSHGATVLDLSVIEEVQVILDLLFYLSIPEHTGLLEENSELNVEGGKGAAVVAFSFGEIDNPWINRGNLRQAFDVARVRLDCNFGNSGIIFGRVRLEPNRLIGFQSGGIKITGGILSPTQPRLNAAVRVMVEVLPTRLLKLLKPGVEVTNQQARNVAGTLKRVLDIDRLETSKALSFETQSGFSRNFNRVLLDLELDCTLNLGIPLFLGQPIDFGRNLSFALLGQPLTGIVSYEDKLPPREEPVREEIQVEFSSVPPELVAWIRDGEQEFSPNGPSTWKIKRVISDKPTKILYPSTDGRQALLVDHPENRAIRCLVELEMLKVGSDIYYRGTMLKIGSSISFNARRWALGARVVVF